MSLDIYLNIDIDTGNPNTDHSVEVYWANYTHNVTPMWEKAGVYHALYSYDGVFAKHIIETLENGVNLMRENSEEYEALNPPNGYGNYETALVFLENFHRACVEYPNAKIRVSR